MELQINCMLKICISYRREDTATYAQLPVNLNSEDTCSEVHLFFLIVFGSMLVLNGFFLQGFKQWYYMFLCMQS